MSYEWYHAHVYFDDSTFQKANDLRLKAQAQFRNRIRLSAMINRPIGPHPLPMFELDFYGTDYKEVVGWLETHRQGLDILIHPISGDQLADHTTLAIFLGKKLDLNLDALKS